jgi:2-C-methyl-D-erythritol 4-phosphate cytidylyltransferase
VIPAAGLGSRMGGGPPKQYLALAGATVLEHSLGALLAQRRLAGVAVALHPQDRQAAQLTCFADSRVITVVGGAERSDSVAAALEALSQAADPGDWVLVHDAARPCVEQRDIERLLDRVIADGIGGILAEPLVDTVKRADAGGRVLETLDRSCLWRAQTPQMFRLGELRDALRKAAAEGARVTDEASAMERAGLPVQLVAGSRRNLKITVPADLSLAAWYMAHPDSEAIA